jgi:hypothetical protein
MSLPLIASFGGGVNSTAMLVGMQERRIYPSTVIFADTGGEKPETYEFLNRLTGWLAQWGFPPLTIVSNDGIHRTLERDCLTRNTMPSLVFGWKSCSDKYKRRPIEKFIKPWGEVTMAVGIDAGELRRVSKNFDTERVKYWHPLIEWGWDRAACIAAINRAGLPVPVKSACFFCPASKKSEVIELSASHPDLFARAVAMERASVGLTAIKGLGRHWSWEELVKNSEAQQQMFPEAIQTPCICFDGEDD